MSKRNSFFSILGILLLIIICFSLFSIAVGWISKSNQTSFFGGFGPYDKDLQGARPITIWDLLDLFIVPLFIVIAAWVLSSSDKWVERNTESERQKQETLEKFYERISNLLLEKKLNKSNRSSNARNIARSWALAALQRLDASRKGEALHFLYRTNLIDKGAIINLNGANLRYSDLQNAVLVEAEIMGAYFSGSNLRGANLKSANFTGCDLRKVDLRDSILDDTNLSFTHLNRSDLRNLDLSVVNLKGANLKGARIWGTKLNDEQLDLVVITKLQQMIFLTSMSMRKKK